MFKIYSNLYWYARSAQTLNSRGLHKSPTTPQAKLLDGTKVAKAIRSELTVEVDKLIQDGYRQPKLVAVLVGNDPASSIYIRNKMRAAKDVGIISASLKLPATISMSELTQHIEELNNDPKVDGVIVQLPLPQHLVTRDVINMVAPSKDVDGFNFVNMGKFFLNMEAFVPCTVLGVYELIRAYGIETSGKNAVVCGRSKNLGMPMAMLFHSDVFESQGDETSISLNATTTICHRNTPPDQLKMLTKNADIIVSAAGVPNLITADMVKEGSCVIDIGVNRIADPVTGKTKVVGDVDFEGVRKVAGHISPVPGGVGPMTVAMLMRNTIRAAKLNLSIDSNSKHNAKSQVLN